MSNDIKKVLVIGAVGQIGSELTLALRDRFGGDNVVAMGPCPTTSLKVVLR